MSRRGKKERPSEFLYPARPDLWLCMECGVDVCIIHIGERQILLDPGTRREIRGGRERDLAQEHKCKNVARDR